MDSKKNGNGLRLTLRLDSTQTNIVRKFWWFMFLIVKKKKKESLAAKAGEGEDAIDGGSPEVIKSIFE